jgi:hypothetical protein
LGLITRSLAGIAGLLLVVFVTILLMVPEAIVALVQALTEIPLVTRIAVVLIIYIGLLAVLYSRIRVRQRPTGDALIVHASGAEAAVTVDSVHSLVLKTVRGIPDVSSVKADVQSINGKADVSLSITTDNDTVNVPNKQREIHRALEQVIKKQLGLQMAGRPRINIQFASATANPEMVVYKPISVPPIAPVIPEETEEPSGGLFNQIGFDQRDNDEDEVEDNEPLITPRPDLMGSTETLDEEDRDL